MDVVEARASKAPSLDDLSAFAERVQVGEDAEAGGSNAPSLRDLSAFLKGGVHSSVPIFYSSEISCCLKSRSRKQSNEFNVVLIRRYSRVTEQSPELVRSPIFRIAETNFMKAIRTLIACSTWTHAQFCFSNSSSNFDFVPDFEYLMFEVFSILRSSPSLSCFDIRNPWFCYKHLPTLVYENPLLETLIVHPGGPIGATDFSLLAKTVALCLSQNSVLKSFTIQIPSSDSTHRESLEILLRPFTTSSQGEANTDLSGRTQANTTLSTLHLDFLSHDVGNGSFYDQPEAFMDDLVVILNVLASMLKANTTLKHVQLSHASCKVWRNLDDGMLFKRRHVEFGTQEQLKLMICNELRVNTSLKSFAVGFWRLCRVGNKWRTSYGGPCLKKPTEEYIVQVQIPP